MTEKDPAVWRGLSGEPCGFRTAKRSATIFIFETMRAVWHYTWMSDVGVEDIGNTT